MARFDQPIKPMTLGNTRVLGVPSLDVSCWNCHHQAVLSANRCRITSPVPTFRPQSAHQKNPGQMAGAPDTDIYRRFLTRSST
jgi:hypothetical protein